MEKVGLMKVEGTVQKLLRVVLCCAKNYLNIYEDEMGVGEILTRKCKGANPTTASNLTEKHYIDAVDSNILLRYDQTSINSFNCQLYTTVTNKRIISSMDFKNYYLNERECVPFNHVRSKNAF